MMIELSCIPTWIEKFGSEPYRPVTFQRYERFDSILFADERKVWPAGGLMDECTERPLMRVYLAAKFEMRSEIRERADQLWRLGIEVVSSWIHETECPLYMDEPTFRRKLAAKDLQEVKLADLLILDTSEISEGKSVEFGFALAQGQTKLVWVVGPRRSIFHELADETFLDWAAVMRKLAPSLIPLRRVLP